MQDVLAKAYLKWDRVVRAEMPDVYIRRMIINASHSWWRRPMNRELPVDAAADRPGGGDPGARRRRAGPRCGATICALPARQRAVLALRYYEDLDDETIGRILNCSPATVRTHVDAGALHLARPLLDRRRAMTDIETRVAESMRARADAAAPTGGLHGRVCAAPPACVRRRRRVRRGGRGRRRGRGGRRRPAAPGFLPIGGRGSLPTSPRQPGRRRRRRPARRDRRRCRSWPACRRRPTGRPPSARTRSRCTSTSTWRRSTHRLGVDVRHPDTRSSPPRTARTAQFIEAMIGTDPAVLDAQRNPPGTACSCPTARWCRRFTETPVGDGDHRRPPGDAVPGERHGEADDDRPRHGRRGADAGGDRPAWVLRWQPVDGAARARAGLRLRPRRRRDASPARCGWTTPSGARRRCGWPFRPPAAR